MNEELLNIERIRVLIKQRKIKWTIHCLNRINKRNIFMSDIKRAIGTGRIIEYYFDDFPYPSCLILGVDWNDQLLHVVCGVSKEYVYMITAYYPGEDKWEKDMETRR